MGRPDERQPGRVPCAHCGEGSGQIACHACHFVVCGACALADCPQARDEAPAPPAVEGVLIDRAHRTLRCDGDEATFDDVLAVIVEMQRFAGWTDLHYEYRVRIVLGDRRRDFFAVRIRSLSRLPDLDQLVVARGEALARELGVGLRVERG